MTLRLSGRSKSGFGVKVSDGNRREGVVFGNGGFIALPEAKNEIITLAKGISPENDPRSPMAMPSRKERAA